MRYNTIYFQFGVAHFLGPPLRDVAAIAIGSGGDVSCDTSLISDTRPSARLHGSARVGRRVGVVVGRKLKVAARFTE